MTGAVRVAVLTGEAAGIGARIPALDAVRGIAVVLMIVYHGLWDANHLGLSDLPLFAAAPWLALRAAILTLFLLCVGAGLTLAHQAAVRWRPFFRRLAVVGAGALLITAGTRALFAEGYVTFGVLHHIAVASVLGLAALRLPAPVVAILAIAAVALPSAVADAAFDGRWMAWTGFARTPPYAVDHVPLFPWFGAVLAGMLAGRGLARAARQGALWCAWGASAPLGGAIRWLGRHSLAVYLLHQPVLMGSLWLLAGAPRP